MNRSWIKLPDITCTEYREGINSFLMVAKKSLDAKGRTRCPCKICMNFYFNDIKSIESHLYDKGISSTYDQWVYHGETALMKKRKHGEKADLSGFVKQEPSVIKEAIVSPHSEQSASVIKETVVPPHSQPTCFVRLESSSIKEATVSPHSEQTSSVDKETSDINDLQDPVLDNGTENELSTGATERVTGSTFDELLSEAREQLYPGCAQFSMLDFLVKLMHMKLVNSWSNRSFDMLLQLLRGAFPNGANLPRSYHDAMKRLCEMGLGYHLIHVCKYDCVLFRKEYEKCEHCPMCGESRYKVEDGKDIKVPHKVLYHFPLIPRLQRLFSSKHTAREMRWHKDERVESNGVLKHPADAEGWKHFDKQFPWFAAEPRNVRLSLALDSFNPFGNTSPPHSMWPVILAPYNLPPWKCMKEAFFFMTLLIPGPQSPEKEIDIYLQPLIEELKQLWTIGVRTFDSSKGEYFQLHAALLWTISDLPIYGDLSGWNTKGYKACPICNEDTISTRLREKFCFTGHRCYLPADHAWRTSKKHNGNEEHRLQPKIRNGEEILQQVSALRISRFGKNPTKQEKKRKRNFDEFSWTKRSIFFELPYWSKLMLRHKLDVISVERSICDNLLNTLLDIDGKTTDTLMARLDLEDLRIRKELHIKKIGDNYFKPHASYTLDADKRVDFCKFLKSVKFPFGFPSSISRCVKVREGKVWGLKSYDYHILMHRLLPIGIRTYFEKNIHTSIIEMCNFFRKLCAKTVQSQDLDKLQDEIVEILCKFEQIFPPTFFDVMVHLAVHLPYETKIVGPVHYGCMHPFGQSLNNLKQYVKDKTCPESSIAEAYTVTESLKFCSMYLQGIETGPNRNDSNNDSCDGNKNGGESEISVFRQNARLIGEPKSRHLSLKDVELAHLCILSYCDESKPYLKQRAGTRKLKGTNDIQKMQELQFPTWFKNKAQTLHQEGNISDELYTLSLGPDCFANSYSGCIVNGLRFHTKDYDNGPDHNYGQTSQNSGIMVRGFHGKDEVNFYGELCEVLELQYKNERVLLFKCEWFDSYRSKYSSRNEQGFVSINSGRWYQPRPQDQADQPFVLVNEAKQVFYLDDCKKGKDWKVVQFVQPGHLWDVPEIENDEENYEDESSEPMDLVSNVVLKPDSMEFGNLSRTDVEPVLVEGDVEAMKLNIFGDSTIIKELSEDDLEDDDSGLFDSLTSNTTDDE